MPSKSSSFTSQFVARWIRPLFLFVTFTTVVFAVLQGFGRLSMAAVEHFEEDINTLVEAQGIRFEGLHGGWRGFNPILKAEQLFHPAVQLSGMELEVDVFESLLRGQIIPRRFLVADGTVFIVRVGGAWQLRGQSGAAKFDIESILRNLDSLAGNVSVAFMDGGDQQANLDVQARLANRGGRHYLNLLVKNAAMAERGLSLELWQSDSLGGSIAEPFNRIDVDHRFVAELDGEIVLPKLLTRLSPISLQVDDFSWYASRHLDGPGAGAGHVMLSGIQLAGAASEFAGSIDVLAVAKDRKFEGQLQNVHLTGAGASMSVEPVHFAFDLDKLQPDDQLQILPEALTLTTFTDVSKDKPALRTWIGELDLSKVSAFLNEHTKQWQIAGIKNRHLQAASDWISALDLQGSARNVHVFVDPEFGTGYSASIVDLDMQAFKGSPFLQGAQGVLWGYGNGIAMQLNSQDIEVQFPELFHQRWRMDQLSGRMSAWFKSGHLALQGKNLKLNMGEVTIGGVFSLDRPEQKSEQRIALRINLDEIDLLAAKQYIPYKIPKQLSEWLEVGPQGGRLQDVRFAYHGSVHAPPNSSERRMELLSNLSQGVVKYDSAWPKVTDFEGSVYVAGPITHVDLVRAKVLDVDLRNTQVSILEGGAYAKLRLGADADAANVLAFVRKTPLADSMKFITPDWEALGRMSFSGDLMVPIKLDEAPPLAVDLDFSVADMRLSMPEYRSELTNLQGSGHFSLPYSLSGSFTADLFERPANIVASHDADWVKFSIAGTATPEDIYQIIAYDSEFPVSGEMEFDSLLSISMGAGVTNLSLTTDMVGMQIDLPAEFGKSAEVAEETEIAVQFLRNYQSVSWRYKTTNGWLHYGKTIERGAIGISQPPPMTQQDEAAIKISGYMPRLDMADWVSDNESSIALPIDWSIRNLNVDQFVLDELTFSKLTLNGYQNDRGIGFQFESDSLAGTVFLDPQAPMQLDLTRLQLPALADTATDPLATLNDDLIVRSDPLSVDVGRSLPAAFVQVDELVVGERPFGAWKFEIKPTVDGIRFENFNAHINGVHIEDELLEWNLIDNKTHFSGDLILDDLEQTLPQWGYAANLQTSKAHLMMQTAWAGSPANVNLLGLNGNLQLTAEDGRFLEVEPGQGVKILSLVNFSKIAKRISFDFSDVGGKGISFDELDAQVSLANGHLKFLERMTVESSSGDFQFGGQVNLNTGELNNEMVVTLPVSNSLPWYGVYLALANPLAGLGVLLGERVLRKPIQQFSSAKFSVQGTLDEPDVKFVSLWDKSMATPKNANAKSGDEATKRKQKKRAKRKSNLSPGERALEESLGEVEG